ncbi:PP2C family protein-serine/threonine phosphatase [Rariglobus hedericola]|uniref:Serine/threonine-protein phosphatase n=1 Tax=Rariglobus hedericola TaxID=2597822 RepID=A0A556QMZ3_9BACT|nr:PP2C family serine/threonine-protein phosphatase [Rariglobus hedericola]TSJ78004.1 serine/threonine-protein phosphatase [Rariglobus hedericola]
MKYRSAAITDIGKTRFENEDRFLRDDALGLFGVADGIGGLPGGAEAAECTVEGITRGFIEGAQPDLIKLTQTTSLSVQKLGQQLNPPYGIGSTLTFGSFKNGQLQLAHVGDSRAYVFQKGDFLPLTEDHTVENEARRLRARGEDMEISIENRNALTRCIGQPGLPEVDFQEFIVTKGDRYFFTTDGICRMIADEELAEIISGPESPAEMLQLILDLALKRGGHDNLTAVLIFIDEA